MLSKWKVREVSVAGTTFYEVYRMTDSATKKNREESVGGYWSTRAEAQALADSRNKEDFKWI